MKQEKSPIINLSNSPSNCLNLIHKSGLSSVSTQNFIAFDAFHIYSAGNNIFIDTNPTSQDKCNIYELVGHDAEVSCLTTYIDQNLIASGQLASPGNKNYDSQVLLWTLKDRKLVGRFIGLKQGVKGLTFSADSNYLAGVSYKDQLIIWNLKQNSQLFAKNFEGPSQILNFSTDILTIAIGKSLNFISLVPLISQNKPPVFTNFVLPSTGLPRSYTCIADLGNGIFVLGTQSGQLCVFNKGIFKSAIVCGKGCVGSIGVLGKGKEIIGAVGGEVVKYDIIGQQLKQKDRKSTNEWIKTISITQKGQIFGLTKNSLLMLSSNLTSTIISQFHSSKIRGLANRNSIITSIDEDGTVITRNIKNGNSQVINLWRYSQPGTCVEVCHDGKIVVGFRDGKIFGLGLDGKKVEWEVAAHKGAVTTIFGAFEGYMLTGGDDSVVRIWSKNKQLINQVSAHQKTVTKVLGEISASHIIHSCSYDRSIQTYDLKTDKKLYFRQALGGSLTDMIQNIKTGDLITCGVGCTVSFWRGSQHQPYNNLQLQTGNPLKLAINSSGSLLAIGCDNGLIALFNVAKNCHIGNVQGHSRCITAMSWIGENTLSTVSQDHCFAIWTYQ